MTRAPTGILILAVLLCGPVLADSRAKFLRQKLIADNSAIVLGRLAAEKAKSAAVRAFGRILVDDHSISRQRVLSVGQELGMDATNQISREAREEQSTLLRMQDREFDREFIEYMVDNHQTAISIFREVGMQPHGPVSWLAQRALPVVEKHLLMAQSLRGNNGSFYEGWESRRQLTGLGTGLYAP